VPGIYLGAILVSLLGIALVDVRFRLALRPHPGRTLLATVAGTVFFLAWDLAGIAAGVFVQGDSPLYVGVELAPHLPLEEVAFLMFLSYLTLVCWNAALRLQGRRDGRGETTTEPDPS